MNTLIQVKLNSHLLLNAIFLHLISFTAQGQSNDLMLEYKYLNHAKGYTRVAALQNTGDFQVWKVANGGSHSSSLEKQGTISPESLAKLRKIVRKLDSLSAEGTYTYGRPASDQPSYEYKYLNGSKLKTIRITLDSDRKVPPSIYGELQKIQTTLVDSKVIDY